MGGGARVFCGGHFLCENHEKETECRQTAATRSGEGALGVTDGQRFKGCHAVAALDLNCWMHDSHASGLIEDFQLI